MCARGADNSIKQPRFEIETNAMAFFHDRVQEASKRQKLRIKENVEYYIVNLLVDHLQVNPSLQTECLALALAKAQESPHGEQVLLFKQIGDTSLYFAGFFQEFFIKKGLDISYCISMGSNAYLQLSGLMRGRRRGENYMAQTYSDLASAFREAVAILLDVSKQTLHQGEPSSDTLILYEAWLDTASQGLEQELLERGIIPIASKKKTLQ